MTSLRQINANRANAQHSTGPKSESGRAIAARNALKHGLSGEGLVLPDEEAAAVEDRIQQWDSSFHPFDQADVWLVRVVATESVRVERCQVHEASLRERQARRADAFWDDDRRLAAEVLAASLAKKPEIISRQLRQTTQGADVLIERWRFLDNALDRNGDWDERQRSMALDLLGVPGDLRDGPTRLDPPDGSSAAEWLREAVLGQVAGLLALKPALDELDGQEQAAAMLGLEPSPDSELKRLRRYEAACMRRFQWAYNKLKARRKPERPPALAVGLIEPGPPIDPEAEQARHWERMVDAVMDPDHADPALAYEAARMVDAMLGQMPAPRPSPIIPERPAPVRTPAPVAGNRRARRTAELKARRS